MNAREVIEVVDFKGEVRYGEPMSRHTSLCIGGPAEAMAWPKDTDEVAKLRAAAYKNEVPVFILGNGTNLLVLDGGIPGLVINISKLDWLEKEDAMVVRAGAGTPLPRLANFCADEGLSGLEFAAGIPGTVGGAVFMNAGAYGYEIKDVLHKIRVVMEDGSIFDITTHGLEKRYRHGGIPENSAVTEAWFKLAPGDAEAIKAKASEYIAKRKASQPLSARSAGSCFKNPQGQKAWKLIEAAGLKGTRVGGAQVSEKHANFLINAEGATAKDFRALMELVRKTVKEKMGIELEPEVRIVGVEKNA